MKRKIAITIMALGLTIAPAFAQFPPPGIYQCVDMSGKAFGILSLEVAGDYEFQSPITVGGTGQVASSGNSVTAVSGPLADIDLAGSFSTDANDATSFMFTSTLGSVLCAVPVR